MAEAMADVRLEVVLRSVGEHLVVPPVPQVVAAAPARSRHRRRALVAAAAALALLVAASTLNPVQDAVAEIADWLGIGSTRVQHVGQGADPTGHPPVEAGVPAIAAGEAARRLGRPLPATPLGRPGLVAAPPEGGVLLGWDAAATTLWIRAFVDEPGAYFDKLLDVDAKVTAVPDLGAAAVAITGDHVLTTPHRRVAAESVVLWVDDGLEYRLEGDASRERLLATARAIDRENSPARATQRGEVGADAMPGNETRRRGRYLPHALHD
jgi:hypothetical protein